MLLSRDLATTAAVSKFKKMNFMKVTHLCQPVDQKGKTALLFMYRM
jgi:hypothetical protein